MVVHFLEDQPLRELVEKTEKHSVEYDVLAQTSILSLELFGEDCIEEYSKPGAAGRLWVMYDFGSPSNNKNDGMSAATESTVDSASFIDEEEKEGEEWTQPEPGCRGRPRMLGFLLAKLLPNTGLKGGQAFTIVFAGVPSNLRKKGTGRKLVASVIKHGRARQNISLVTLSALPNAISFWERCGLKRFDGAMKSQEGAAPGQVYMELSVRGKGKKKR